MTFLLYSFCLLLSNFLLLGVHLSVSQRRDDGHQIERHVKYDEIFKNFSAAMNQLFHNVTKFTKVKEIYDQQFHEGLLQLKQINGSRVRKIFADNLNELLTVHSEDLYKIKKKLVALKRKHINPDQANDCSYFKHDYKVKYEPDFSKTLEVSFNKSFWHVPTDIYNCSGHILHIFTWTQRIDEVFRSNYESNKSLRWQYFTSKIGATKVYPGFEYKNRSSRIYDGWTTEYYNQATSSPKDIVILLDMSGSMTGMNLNIAKFLTRALISNFQPDDFFNVLLFNQETSYLFPDIHSLKQATSFYKTAFINAVNELENTKLECNVSQALKMGFETIANTSESSNCTKVIMLISDGIDSNPNIQRDLERYNRDKNVVIFSYIIGNKDDVVMKDIACSNNGQSFQVAAMGNVLGQVLRYQKVLNKPLATEQGNHTVFTPLYKRTEASSEMVSSIVTGVFFNDANNTTGELLGVAGVDILHATLEQRHPTREMGVFGHAFAINNNGFFLTHPRLKEDTYPGSDDAYLENIERTVGNETAAEIAKQMIKSKTGCQDVWTNWFFPKKTEKRNALLKFKYCYQPIPEKPFSVAVAIISAQHQVVVAENASEKMPFGGSNEERKGEMKWWLSCNNISSSTQTKEPCNVNILKTLITSESPTTKTSRYNDVLNQYEVYLITSSGLFTLSSTNMKEMCRSSYLEEDILEEERFLHPQSFSDRCNDRLIFTVNTSWDYNNKSNTLNKIAVGKSICATDNDTVVAVVGMMWESTTSQTLSNFFGNLSKYHRQSTSPLSSVTQEPDFFLIDENGYIVANNGYNLTGYFLGDVNILNRKLMELFVNALVFDKHDFKKKVKCEDTVRNNISNTMSAGRVLKNLYEVLLEAVVNFIGLFSSLTLHMVRAVISISMSMISLGADCKVSIFSIRKRMDCIEIVSVYKLRNQSMDSSGSFDFRGCMFNYSIKSVSGTNLALVTVARDTNENCKIVTKRLSYDELKKKIIIPVHVTEDLIHNRKKSYRNTNLSVCFKSTGNNSTCSIQHSDDSENMMMYLIISFAVCFAVIVVFYLCQRYNYLFYIW